MSYKKEIIKEGINLHIINTNRFKTDLIAVFLTTPISRENVTKDALINLILRRGTKNMPTQEDISKSLENMYGAEFDCGIDKTGDNHVLKFYTESINNEYTPEKEDVLKESLDILFDIIFNPVIEEDGFKNEYFNSEREKLSQIIDSKIDDKSVYSINRCIEEMYKEKPYGLYQYGFTEDLDKISAISLYIYYKKLISECKIDIFVSGEIKEDILMLISDNKNILNLNSRTPFYIVNDNKVNDIHETKETKIVTESMNVAQGKLVMGLNVENIDTNSKYTTLVYNTILGGTANSKLFQNVREKERLAYTTGSSYVRPKNNIFIRCGIEIDKYEKAVSIIKLQIDDMKNGNFTDEDINNAKNSLISTINGIEDEQDTEVTYYLGQELSNSKCTINEYMKNIEKITKDDIVNIAKKISIDIIYFLKD